MPYEVRGVVARAKGEPVAVEMIVVPDPGPGEALVDVAACGVCHTDLHYREGGINDDFPFLLGHEASGVVAAVDAFVSEKLGLGDVEAVFAKMARGEILRSVVVLDSD